MRKTKAWLFWALWKNGGLFVGGVLQKGTNTDAALRFENTSNRPVLHGDNNERPIEKKIQIPQGSAMKNNQTARQADRSTCVSRDVKRFVVLNRQWSSVGWNWLTWCLFVVNFAGFCWGMRSPTSADSTCTPFFDDCFLSF